MFTTIALIVSATTTPGGAVLQVPSEYPTLEAAAAAIVFPQFQSVQVAPGTYALEDVNTDFHGATVSHAPNMPGEVVLVGGSIQNAVLESVTLSAVWATNVECDSCVVEGGVNYGPYTLHASTVDGSTISADCFATDSTLTNIAGHFGSFHCTNCAIVGSNHFESLNAVGCTLTSASGVTNAFYVGSATLLDCACSMNGMIIQALGIDADRCIFDDSPVSLRASNMRRCLLRNCSSTALFTNTSDGGFGLVQACTFVGNNIDIGMLCCWIPGCASSSIVNSIVTSIVFLDETCVGQSQLNNLPATPDVVNADGSLPIGSPAIGAGNPYLMDPALCGVNIGWDQPEPCLFVWGDVTGDGAVNGADLGAMLASWGQPLPEADFNVDGVVDGADLGLLLGYWGG